LDDDDDTRKDIALRSGPAPGIYGIHDKDGEESSSDESGSDSDGRAKSNNKSDSDVDVESNNKIDSDSDEGPVGVLVLYCTETEDDLILVYKDEDAEIVYEHPSCTYC